MLDLSQPHALTDIVKSVSDKTVIGSVMRTAEWQRMPAALRDQAFFSAGVTQAEFLARQRELIVKAIGRAKEVNAKGESYWASGRAHFIAQCRQLGQSLGVQHPAGDRDGKIIETDITDPLSIARLKLIYDTQLELAYGKADYLTGMDADLLAAFPAWELVRISTREQPRDWPARWTEAAQAVGWEGVNSDTKDDRMIALKTSGIWIALSRFKKPHPPFDFNSGMGVADIDRDEAETLGLMGPDDELVPTVAAYDEQMQASVSGLGAAEKDKLKKIFKGRIEIEGPTVYYRDERVANQPPPRADGRDLEFKKQIVPQPKPGRGLLLDPGKATKEEAELINLAHERAWGYAAEGKPLGFVEGTATSVRFDDAWLKPGFTCTHNHPSGASFSAADLYTAGMAQLRELRAIGNQGRDRRWLYRLSMGGMTPDEVTDAVNRYDALREQVGDELALLVDANKMTAKAMVRNLAHLVMMRLSDELRGLLTYERIKL